MKILFLITMIIGIHCHARLWTYEIQIFPSRGETCQKKSEDLLSHFLKETPLPTAQAFCKVQTLRENSGPTYNTFRLTLQYEDGLIDSHDPLIYSAYYGYSEGRGNNERGFYDNFKECLSDLPNRALEFTKNSQKNLLAFTCERTRNPHRLGVVARMDTVGIPLRNLFSYDGAFSTNGQRTFSKAIEKVLVANGAAIVSSKNNFYLYFAKDEIRPGFHSFGEMKLRECQSQLPRVYNILKEIPPIELTVICQGIQHGGKKLAKAVGIWNQNQNHSLMMDRVYESYPTYEECLADQERQIRRNHESRVFPQIALCRIEDNSLEMGQTLYTMDLY